MAEVAALAIVPSRRARERPAKANPSIDGTSSIGATARSARADVVSVLPSAARQDIEKRGLSKAMSRVIRKDIIRLTSRNVGRKQPGRRRVSEAKLDALIAEATVDAYDESEQLTGFHTMLDEHLEMPFQTQVLGVEVTAEQVDLTDDNHIVVVCRRDKWCQRIPLLDLPLPRPPPQGAEWIDAYRRWASGR